MIKRNVVSTEDIMKVERHIVNIMIDLGIEQTEDNSETPERIARMLCLEVFRNRNMGLEDLASQMTTFTNPNKGSSTPITIKGIKFTSTCEHHWLPFTGYADITYIPNGEILGLSKFPRVVKWFCKKPQVQERLTREIGEFLVDLLHPLELHVTLRDVHHSCVEARGVEAICETDTQYNYEFESQPSLSELLGR